MDLPLDSKYVRIKRKKKTASKNLKPTTPPIFFQLLFLSKKKKKVKSNANSTVACNDKLECFTFTGQGISRVRKTRRA